MKYDDGWIAQIYAMFLDIEKITPLWTEFNISRVSGHKVIERYKYNG